MRSKMLVTLTALALSMASVPALAQDGPKTDWGECAGKTIGTGDCIDFHGGKLWIPNGIGDQLQTFWTGQVQGLDQTLAATDEAKALEAARVKAVEARNAFLAASQAFDAIREKLMAEKAAALRAERDRLVAESTN